MTKNKHLKDYIKPNFQLPEIELTIDLNENRTLILAKISYILDDNSHELKLDGKNLELIDLACDDKKIDAQDFTTDSESLTIRNLPQQGVLAINLAINPKVNRALEGLYIANGIYTTQCEAEGFRKICYFADRPDVLSHYRVIIRADASLKNLLSNGNLVSKGELQDGRIYAIWDDPFPKPSYLFALVAGDLSEHRDEFITKNGRKVQLSIWYESQYQGRTDFAMQCLKSAMKYDEERFNLQYDGDIFQIVAITDFNMGAMENKSLNIFNAKYILASPKTSLDQDFFNIDAIIAHEYFHNWTGNRVTVRDWFQLSLKEGLTVFRDQEYSADKYSRVLCRIDNVRNLRTHQFPEDAGGLAHPIRPDSYQAVDNFYTATIYEKGAEIISMMHRIVGESQFIKGFSQYIAKNDGKPAIIEDFIDAIFEDTNFDKSRILNWYKTAGTPQITIKERFYSKAQKYQLIITQYNDKDPTNTPAYIPIECGLLDRQGKLIPIQSQDCHEVRENGCLLILSQNRQEFSFYGIKSKPVLSFNRNFTAPIIVHHQMLPAELSLLSKYDTDEFNRWQASFQCALLAISHPHQIKRDIYQDLYFEGFAHQLQNVSDIGFLSQSLATPTYLECGEGMVEIQPHLLYERRKDFRQKLVAKFHQEIYQKYQESMQACLENRDKTNHHALLRVLCGFIGEENFPNNEAILQSHYDNASDFETKYTALLACLNLPFGKALRQDFYESIQNDEILLDKYLALEGAVQHQDSLQNIKNIFATKVKIDKPNQVRAVINSFAAQNPYYFHQDESYQFISDIILQCDKINPNIAARFINLFKSYDKFSDKFKHKQRDLLMNIQLTPNISDNLLEMVNRLLKV